MIRPATPPKTSTALNVLGTPLKNCSTSPMTGFFRNGCCDTHPQDVGSHTVCVIVTDGFLLFFKSRGNDLSTPMPEYHFPGLSAGDKWCLCAERWLEAYEAGCAPKVVLQATHEHALKTIPLKPLQEHATS